MAYAEHPPATGRDWSSVTSTRVLADGALAGRRAIVTGAGTGIGRAIALRFVELGAEVVGFGRRIEKLDETVDAATGLPGSFRGEALDIRDDESVVQQISAAAGDALDILVNNAGGQFYAPADAISPNGFRSVVELNLQAVYAVIKAARDGLVARGGSILNISLSGVERGGVGMAHSVAARAGVLGLTRTLALEWAEYGVRANCVGPGLVLTDQLPDGVATTLERDLVPRSIPVGRATPVEDVAEYAAFLASPAGRMITGQLVQVDGAASLGHGLYMES